MKVKKMTKGNEKQSKKKKIMFKINGKNQVQNKRVKE